MAKSSLLSQHKLVDYKHICANNLYKDMDVHLSLEAGQAAGQGQQYLLHHADPMAMNSATHPTNVRPQTLDLVLHPSDLRLESPAHSHLVARLRLAS